MELINFEECAAVLTEYAAAVRNQYKDNLVSSGRPASGHLLNSVDYRIDVGDRYYEVVLSLEDYWKYVEKGTAPHWPPVNKILEWIQIKPVIPRPDDKGRIPSAKQLAFLISRKISRVGTTGSDDLESAIDTINKQFKDKIIIAINHDLSNYIYKVLVGRFDQNAIR